MTNITLHSCSAELISAGSFADIERAWITSRPNDPNPDMEKVLSMDVPVNEFLPMHFELFAPILIREIICSFRNHVVWARSSRVDDLNDWKLFRGLGDQGVHECLKLWHTMQKEMKENHQDDFRRHLPLAYMTKFSFTMTFRDLVRFLCFLHQEKNVLFDDVFASLQQAIINKAPEIAEKTLLAINQGWYKVTNYFPPIDNKMDGLRVGDFIAVHLETSLQLRAQLIRHRAIQFKDDICFYFPVALLHASMASFIEMQLMIPVDFADTLVRKRSCWIAQTDLWQLLIEKLQQILGGEKVLLPCDDGTCRFKRDNDLRKQGHDPSPPCPKAAILEGEPMAESEKADAWLYAERRPQQEFWKNLIRNEEEV